MKARIAAAFVLLLSDAMLTQPVSATDAPGTSIAPATNSGAVQELSAAEQQAREKAAAEMRAAGVRQPENLDVLNQRGYFYLYEKRDTKRAIQLFRWNLALFPESAARPDMLDSLAEAYVQSGNRELAIRTWDEALGRTKKLQTREEAAKLLERLQAGEQNLTGVQRDLQQSYMDGPLHAAFLKSNPTEP